MFRIGRICVSRTNSYIISKKHFSFESTVQNLAQNQTGIFKFLSESTPVEYTQKLLVNLHDLTGLPWYGTIICTTVLMRTFVTLPLAVYQHYVIARLQNLRLEMPAIVKELKRETAIAIKLYNWDEKTAKMAYNQSVRKQWNELIIRDNCHPFKASLLMLVQIPMWLSLSISLRNLVYMLPDRDLNAELTFAELSFGGFGFIPNLTEVDSSFIFPVALGLLNLAIIEIQVLSRKNDPVKFQKYLTYFLRGFSVFMIPIAATVPSCLALYWTTSSAYGLIQNIVLLSPKVKRFFNIPITESEIEKPYKFIFERLKNKFNKLKNE